MRLCDPPRRHGRAIPQLQALFGPARTVLPPGFRYLLMLRTDPEGAARKPAAFHDLGAMARHVHGARHGRGLQLVDSMLMLAGQDEAQAGVSVWLLDPHTGERGSYLGWAWVNGASRHTLEAALQTAEPPGPAH